MEDRRAKDGSWQLVGEKAEEILNLRAEVSKKESRTAKLIDRIGHTLSRPAFFCVLLGAHLAWILLNVPVYPWFKPWDPYPFMFLATAASAEAPFIALLVLMYQRRQSRIAELREELDLQVALHLERQSSFILRLLRELHERTGTTTKEDERLLDHLQEELDPERLMEVVRRDLERRRE